MKKVMGVFALSVLLVGCSSSLNQFGNENRKNLMKLSIGMSKQEVMEIMGDKTATGKPGPQNISLIAPSMSVSNPYKVEILKGKEKTFEVLYYYTDVAWDDYHVEHDELTPLVFDDGKLIGWGWSFLEANIQKYEIRFR